MVGDDVDAVRAAFAVASQLLPFEALLLLPFEALLLLPFEALLLLPFGTFSRLCSLPCAEGALH